MTDQHTTLTTDGIPAWAKESIQSVTRLLTDIQSMCLELARTYVAALDRDPRFAGWLIDATEDAGLSAAFWRNVERTGRGQLDPRLVYTSVTHGQAIRRLTLTDQHRALDEHLDLLLPGGDTLKVSLANATTEQARQLLDFDHIRSLTEQRAWLASPERERERKARKTKLPGKDKVEIILRRRCIRVNEPMELTAAQLVTYLQALEK